MKHMRITVAHQNITFSRRMMLLGGAQAAVGGLLIGRMGWLAIAQNQKYQLLSESNRVQLIPVPPRRGWIIDRNGKPIAINKASFRVDLIPQQIVNGPAVIAELQRLMNLPPDEVERITRELSQSRGFQPVSVADNVPYEQYAAITVRLPDLPGVAASRGFTRFYPGGSTVGQLVGYVGAASAAEYEKENKNPLLLIPGVKIGKEGLEQTLESTLRGEPGGQRVEVTARGKLVKELEPKPDRSGGTVQLTIDAASATSPARWWCWTSPMATSWRCRRCRPSTPTTFLTGSARTSGRCCRQTITCRWSIRRWKAFIHRAPRSSRRWRWRCSMPG